MKFFFISFFISVLFVNLSFSQSCKDFYFNCLTDTSTIWSVNSKSSSFHVLPGSTIEIEFEIFKAKDYQISLCGDDYIGNIFDFKLLNKNDKVLFSNQDEDFTNFFSFMCTETQDIIIVVEVPDTGSKTAGCLGILIQETLSLNTGF